MKKLLNRRQAKLDGDYIIANKVKEEKKMTKTMKEIMLENAENAAYIVASDQTTKLLQKALIHLITTNSSPEDASKAEEYVTIFAKSEAGNAAIKLIASMMLLNVPNDAFKNDPRVTKLANTLMTNGMATAGNFVMDAVTDMAPEIMKLVSQIPEQPKVRVPELEQKVHVSTTDTTMASAIEEALEHEQHKPVAKKNHIK